jgi:hypothetical protein
MPLHQRRANPVLLVPSLQPAIFNARFQEQIDLSDLGNDA